jgi:type II secretory pathway component GspD/PulD (secretin)
MMGGMGGGMMGGMGGMGGGMGGMGGGMGGYGGGMGGMGGGMGGMGGGMGGMGGGMMGGMGGMGGGMMGGGMGMTGYMSGIMAQSLRYLIEQTIEPDTWFELSETGEGTITPYPDQQPKKLVVYQTPEVHKQIRDMLDQLRKSLGNQVSIEARFLAVTENFLEDIGLDMDFTANLGGMVGEVTVDQDSFLNARPAATNVSGSLGGLSATPALGMQAGYGSTLDDLQVSLLLRATQARTDSKSLSAPKVTVLSGESAFFYLQDYISYALPPTVSQGTTGTLSGGLTSQGIYTPQSIGTMPVGSNLTITPTITKDRKHVLLNIITTQTDLLRFKQHIVSAPIPGTTGGTTTAGGATTNTAATVLTYPVEVPEWETANVMTRVSVPDRGTLLLGGHKITAAVDKESGVPVLSKIPIINLLFSNRSSVRDQKVLLILVKPTIILQDEMDQEAIAAMEEGTEAGNGL